MKFIIVVFSVLISIVLARNPRCPEGASELPLVDESDCTKFYKCRADNGELVRFDCNPGLEFDPNILVCDWANGRCSKDGSSSVSHSTPTRPTYVTQSTTYTTQLTTSPQVSSSCPINEDPARPTHLPHPTDCTKFYKCLKGVPYEHNCPAGQHWHIKYTYCDYPENAKCVRPL